MVGLEGGRCALSVNSSSKLLCVLQTRISHLFSLLVWTDGEHTSLQSNHVFVVCRRSPQKPKYTPSDHHSARMLAVRDLTQKASNGALIGLAGATLLVTLVAAYWGRRQSYLKSKGVKLWQLSWWRLALCLSLDSTTPTQHYLVYMG